MKGIGEWIVCFSIEERNNGIVGEFTCLEKKMQNVYLGK
jgi:hypothetical protein